MKDQLDIFIPDTLPATPEAAYRAGFVAGHRDGREQQIEASAERIAAEVEQTIRRDLWNDMDSEESAATARIERRAALAETLHQAGISEPTATRKAEQMEQAEWEAQANKDKR